MAFEKLLKPTMRGVQPIPEQAEEKPNFFVDTLMGVPRGIEGAVQSIYDLADFATGDILPDYDTRFLGRSKRFGGTMTEGITQFLTGFIPVAGQLSKVGKLSKLNKAGKRVLNLKGAATAGAVADFTMFQAQEERLSNLIEAFPSLSNPITEYLEADEDDGELEGRLKNTIEGLAIGGVVDSLIGGVKAIKRSRKGDDPESIMGDFYDSYNQQRNDVLLEEDFAETLSFRETINKAFEAKFGGTIVDEGTPVNAYDALQTFDEVYTGELKPIITALLDRGANSLRKTEVMFDAPTLKGKGAGSTYGDNLIKMRQGGARTFVHEMLHAVTVEQLDSSFTEIAKKLNLENPDNMMAGRLVAGNKEALELIAKNAESDPVAGLANAYLKVIKALGREDSVFGRTTEQIKKGKQGDRDTPYGLTNIEEFISEAFTNPEFRKILAELPSETQNRSMFEDFLDSLLKILGLDKSQGSVLRDVFKYTDDIVQKQNAEYADALDYIESFSELSGRIKRNADEKPTGKPDSYYDDLYESGEFGQDRTLDNRGEDFQVPKGERNPVPEIQKDDMVPVREGTLEPFEIDFGRPFRGKDISEVPDSYLRKALEFDSIPDKTKTRISEELDARDAGEASRPNDGFVKSESDEPDANSRVSYQKGVQAVREAEKRGEGVSVLRKKGDQHYGNPFSHLDNAKDTILTKDLEETVANYEKWLKGTDFKDVRPELRAWVIKQIDEGKLDGKALLYYSKQQPNHAEVLDEFIKSKRGTTLRNNKTKAALLMVERGRAEIDSPLTKGEILEPNVATARERYQRYVAAQGGTGGKASPASMSFKEYMENYGITHTTVHNKRGKVIGSKETDEFTSAKFRKEAREFIGSSGTRMERENPLGKGEIVNHSGGAKGSDSVWGELGEEFGVKSNHYYVEGNKTPKGNVAISKQEALKADKALKKANESLGRTFPTSNDYVNNLLRRNFNQVDNADAVYAITEIKGNKPQGGTGWAVQMAVDMGKPVFVYSQEKGQWMSFTNGKWAATDTPVLTNNFAGIGTREITEKGKQAIRDVYEKSFKQSDEGGFGQDSIDDFVQDRINQTSREIGDVNTTGGKQAILNMAKNIRTSKHALALISGIARNLNETGAKQKVTKEELAAETEKTADILGGDKNTWLTAVRGLNDSIPDLQQFRDAQRAAKTLMDLMSRNIVETARKAVEARTSDALNLQRLETEFISKLDQLTEVQRIYSLMGREAGITLLQRNFLGNAKGKYRLNDNVGFDFVAGDPESYARYTTQSVGGSNVKEAIDKFVRYGSDEQVQKGVEEAAGDVLTRGVVKGAKGMFGSKLMRMTTEYWINSLLSGPTTQFVNMIGSGLTTAIRMSELAMGSVMAGDSATRRAIFQYAFNMESIAEAFKFAGKAWRINDSVLVQGSRQFDDQLRRNEMITGENVMEVMGKGRKALGGAQDAVSGAIDFIGKGVRLPSRGLMSVDEFFKQLNYRTYVRTNIAMEALNKNANLTGKELAKIVSEDFDKYITDGGRAYNEGNLYLDAIEKVKGDGIEYGSDQATMIQQELARNPFDPSRSALANAAKNYAEVNTFTNELDNDTVVGKVGNMLGNAKQELGGLNFIIPFVRTPTNILQFSLDRTPLGLAQRGKELLFRKEELTKAVASKDPMEQALAKGKIATGVAFSSAMLWYAMSNKEFITGHGPQNKDEKDALKASGWQPYSFRIPNGKGGHNYFSYQRLDPVATIIGLFADMAEFEDYHDIEGPVLKDLFAMTALSFTQNVTNKSYVKGLDTLLNAFKDPVNNAQGVAGNIVGGFMPSFVMQMQNAGGDRTLRETRTVFDYFFARGTGSGSLPARRNFLGEATIVKNPKLFGAINPVYFSPESKDPVDQELKSLLHGFSKPNSKLMGAIQLKDIYNEDGRQAYDVWLEKTSTTKIGGKTLRQYLHKMVKSKEYQALPAQSQSDIGEKSPRIKAINSWLRAFRAQAKQEMIEEFPELQTSLNELLQQKQQYRLIQ